ncbi:fructosamine kinase family protein [Mycolicibacterium neworleansense]|uniref:Fructosamine kinase-like protein n=1 Tax=Mycolicibacterium neworleansense TaxID=146018 RepID=A0A0H5RTG7_9MYCO|nr:fructosamine kinase family protein [Mycolicibacterium neworleansense]MCV7363185.1 fructosamine kinase family protein [Mycolicibacterium neworleansense]CRZ17081.1 fructosamine kinase-like protein [Mycolicibacterium neworleansense]
MPNAATRGDVYVKRNVMAPTGFFAAEAAGLNWLVVEGGVPCVPVIDYDATSLTLQRLHPVAPTAQAARDFGEQLAHTHDAGAPAYGAGPEGYDGDGFFGPMSQPLPMSLAHRDSWGAFYADERLVPMAELAAAGLDATARAAVVAVAELCRAGTFDDDDGPARLHGDLWSGNVMWTADGAVLIDPAAHGGHRETDLAMLELFGFPFLDEMLAAYESVRPLRGGRQDRVDLHQLYPLLAHVVLFGASYAGQTESAARRVLTKFSKLRIE